MPIWKEFDEEDSVAAMKEVVHEGGGEESNGNYENGEVEGRDNKKVSDKHDGSCKRWRGNEQRRENRNAGVVGQGIDDERIGGEKKKSKGRKRKSVNDESISKGELARGKAVRDTSIGGMRDARGFSGPSRSSRDVSIAEYSAADSPPFLLPLDLLD